MTALGTRLRQLERKAEARGQPASIQILFDDEVAPCADHARCHVEMATGEHHTNLVRLSFGEPTR